MAGGPVFSGFPGLRGKKPGKKTDPTAKVGGKLF
jgi:hypothetical protein